MKKYSLRPSLRPTIDHHRKPVLLLAVQFVLVVHVKPRVAPLAVVQLRSRMNPLVQSQISLPHESLVAELTAARQNSLVYRHLVPLQVRFVRVRAGTTLYGACELAVAVVRLGDFKMPIERFYVTEAVPLAGFFAGFALVLGLLVVDSPVGPEAFLVFERALADRADMLFVVSFEFVLAQIFRVDERARTFVTFVVTGSKPGGVDFFEVGFKVER